MDPFFALYKDEGLIPIEIATNGVIALLAFAGICLNFSLVYVTIKTKSLHRPCNILIALYAFFASFMHIGYSIKFFIFLFGINYVTLRTCYYIQFIPLIGSYIGGMLQFCVGFDRLIGILFPVWYKFGGKLHTFKLLLIFTGVSTIYGTYIGYAGASLHWDKQVMCTFGAPIRQPENAGFANFKAMFTYCGEFICYVLMWLIFCCKKSKVSARKKKLMVSLSIIIAIGLFGYILNMVFNIMILPLLKLDIFMVEYIVSPISVAVFMIVNGSITPVLFICSDEYAKAFRKCFGKPRTVPIHVLPHTHNPISTIH